jgi:hypothetical protein
MILPFVSAFLSQMVFRETGTSRFAVVVVVVVVVVAVQVS